MAQLLRSSNPYAVATLTQYALPPARLRQAHLRFAIAISIRQFPIQPERLISSDTRASRLPDAPLPSSYHLTAVISLLAFVSYTPASHGTSGPAVEVGVTMFVISISTVSEVQMVSMHGIIMFCSLAKCKTNNGRPDDWRAIYKRLCQMFTHHSHILTQCSRWWCFILFLLRNSLDCVSHMCVSWNCHNCTHVAAVYVRT